MKSEGYGKRREKENSDKKTDVTVSHSKLFLIRSRLGSNVLKRSALIHSMLMSNDVFV